MGILQRGLSFVPTSKFDLFNWTKDLNLFARKLRWRKYFCAQEKKQCAELQIPDDLLSDVRLLYSLADMPNETGKGPFTSLHNKSKKMPPHGDISCVDVFLHSVLQDLEAISKISSPTNNCTRAETEVIKNLEKDKKIVIKSSDKGGNIVILDFTQYRQMCINQLSIHSCYEVLHRDPTDIFLNELKPIIIEAKSRGLIDAAEMEFLLPHYPRIATFYCLPKIHKGVNPLKGRPIVSGIDNLTQNCSLYIDKILAPFVQSLPSFTRDTTDLLKRIEDIILEPEQFLVSIDVESLYTSIPHDLGLKATDFFSQYQGTTVSCP